TFTALILQDCQHQIWTVQFSGKDTAFVSPRSQRYTIFGKVVSKGNCSDNSSNTFRLCRNFVCSTASEITREPVAKLFIVNNVELEEGTRLSVEINCGDLEVDEKASNLTILLLKD
ncbi:hypothetical protein DNTS_032424, partial [Danionella cerebrum]